MDFRRRKLFSRKDGFDIPWFFVPAYRHKPATRRARAFRRAVARRIRKQERPAVVREVERELNFDPFEDEGIDSFYLEDDDPDTYRGYPS